MGVLQGEEVGRGWVECCGWGRWVLGLDGMGSGGRQRGLMWFDGMKRDVAWSDGIWFPHIEAHVMCCDVMRCGDVFFPLDVSLSCVMWCVDGCLSCVV